MPAKKKITINRRDRKLIRRPGGLIASSAEIEAIKKLKLKAPKKTYKQLSAEYYQKAQIKTPSRLKNDAGQFLSKKEESEIKKAAKQLNIPLSQALAIFNETRPRLVRVEIGYTMLHSVLPNIDALHERNQNLFIRIKKEGSTRYIKHSFYNGRLIIDEINSKIFARIRKQNGSPLITSPDLPVVKTKEAYLIGTLAPVGFYIDYNSITSLKQLGQQEQQELNNF